LGALGLVEVGEGRISLAIDAASAYLKNKRREVTIEFHLTRGIVKRCGSGPSTARRRVSISARR